MPDSNSQVRSAFDLLRAEKRSAGLNDSQAGLVALRQFIRDARAGTRDVQEVAALVIAEEVKHGRTEAQARAAAKAMLEGRTPDFAPRPNPEARPRRPRARRSSSGAYSFRDGELPLSAVSPELSAYANQSLRTLTGDQP